MSYDTGMLSKMKEFESKHSSSVVVGGGIEKKDVKKHYDNFKELQKKVEKDKKTITNYNQIQDIYNIYDIDEIFKKIDKEFKIIPQDKIKQYNDYIVATNNLVKALIDNNMENINKYTQEHCDLVSKIDKQQIEMQVSILASMKSGNSMLSSMSGANCEKIASSIMTSMSKLNDKLMEQISKPGEKIKFAEKPPVQVTPEEKQAQVSCITNAFIELYNNYYDTQKIETKDTQKRTKLDEHKGKRKVKINKHLKKSIEILFYPTEQDKKPNLKKENKSNYDISLEKFNNYINDICTKYKVENIEKLIEVFKEDTNLKKFARQIQSLQMCCAAREIQETFMENGLSAGIKFN